MPLLYPQVDGGESAQEKVAGLAGVVLRTAGAGDQVAGDIVGEAVSGFADHIRAVHGTLSRSGEACPRIVALHGGLFRDPNAADLLIGPLREHPDVVDLGLTFQTLGVRNGDPDPLIEAVKSSLRASATAGS